MQLITDILLLGGTARTSELLQLGHAPRALTAAVRAGDVVRIRTGHYGLADQLAAGQAAYRVGGHLAGLSALSVRGIWVPAGRHPLEVAVPPHARGLRMPTDARQRLAEGAAVVHWDSAEVIRYPPFAEAVDLAIRRIAHRVVPEQLFAILESAIAQRQLTAGDSDALRQHLAAMDERFLRADHLSGSGGESIVKFWLLGTGLAFTQQVRLDGVGRVDFVIGDRQIAEVDGEAHHSDTHAFEADRRRHAQASILGYRTLRFSARMVEHDIETVAAAITAAVQRGDHLAA